MSSVEGFSAIVDCLADRGLSVTLDTTLRRHPSLEFNSEIFDPDDVLSEAKDCAKTLEAEGVLAPTAVTDTALRQTFEEYKVVAECLERLGYEVPPPPSIDVFVDTIGGAWTPYDVVPTDDGPDELNRAFDECG